MKWGTSDLLGVFGPAVGRDVGWHGIGLLFPFDIQRRMCLVFVATA
jgi:hypothetical protein